MSDIPGTAIAIGTQVLNDLKAGFAQAEETTQQGKGFEGGMRAGESLFVPAALGTGVIGGMRLGFAAGATFSKIISTRAGTVFNQGAHVSTPNQFLQRIDAATQVFDKSLLAAKHAGLGEAALNEGIELSQTSQIASFLPGFSSKLNTKNSLSGLATTSSMDLSLNPLNLVNNRSNVAERAATLCRGSSKSAKTKGFPEQQLSQKGLSHPEALLPEELARVRDWEKVRNAYLKKWRTVDLDTLSKESQKLLKNSKADRVIIRNMTADDLAGILKEGRGVQILKDDGTAYQHIIEWDSASNAITKILDIQTRNSIHGRLTELFKTPSPNAQEVQLLQDKLKDLSKLKDKYTELTQEAICQIEKSKLKR